MSPRGRPRSFDRAVALRRAMEVFWERGYEAASLDELTSAMQISKPSLYAAFSGKEALFREAVALYGQTYGEEATRGLDTEPTARDAVESILRANIAQFTDPGSPPGCMITLTGLLGAPASGPVREFLVQMRGQSQARIRDRLDRALDDGELGPAVDTAGVAAFYTTVLEGLSIQARDGASADIMHGVVDRAMAAWPALTSQPSVPTH